MGFETVEDMRESPRGNSQISLYMKCPREWAWKYLRGWKSTRFEEALTFGSCIHEAQEVFYKTWDFPAMMRRANQFCRSANIPEDRVAGFRKKVYHTLVHWYEEMGQYEKDEVEVLAVEREVNLTLPNGYVMSMRWDRLLRFVRSREVFIADTKTTGWSYGNTITNYMDSAQPMLYILSVEENEPDLFKELSGWRTDCLYVKELKTKINHQFGRSEVVRPSKAILEDIRNSYASVTTDIKFAIDMVEQDDVPPSIAFPCNRGVCHAYNKTCPFLPFCHEIDKDIDPKEGFELDKWLESRVVLDTYKTIKEE